MDATSETTAWPLVDPTLAQDILDLLQQATHYHQVKRGANEATKAVNRSVSEPVVLAADTTPLAIVMHLSMLCEDKNTAYVFVPSKLQLGRACGVSRAVMAASINANEASDLAPRIKRLREKVERLAI